MSLETDLRNDPSCIDIEFAGKERPFLLSVYGAKKARDDMGIDFVERLLAVVRDIGVAYTTREQEIREEQGLGPDEDVEVPWTDLISKLDLSTSELEAIAAAVYAGLVPFEDDLEPKEIEMRLTVSVIGDLLPQIGPTLFSFLQDQAPEQDIAPENGEAETVETIDKEGKKSRSRVSSTSSTPKG